MIGSYNMETPKRNVYLRYIITLLTEKYHVTQASIAKNTGFVPSYIRDFKYGVRNLEVTNLDKIESYINDLYGGILDYEIPKDEKDFTDFVNNLAEESATK